MVATAKSVVLAGEKKIGSDWVLGWVPLALCDFCLFCLVNDEDVGGSEGIMVKRWSQHVSDVMPAASVRFCCLLLN